MTFLSRRAVDEDRFASDSNAGALICQRVQPAFRRVDLVADEIWVNKKRPSCNDSGAKYPFGQGRRPLSMNVANLNPSDKPGSTDRQAAASKSLAEIDAIASQLKATVQDAAQKAQSFDQTERSVRDAIRQIGHQAIELFIWLQGDGDVGQIITTEEGKTLHRSEQTNRTTIRSIFGTHCFEQFTYAPAAKKATQLRPISARMSLPVRQWSYLLQELSQMLAVDQAYEQAMNNLGEILGGSFSVDTAEHVNAELGRDAGEFLDHLPDPPSDSEAKLLVASPDCKGVPLVKGDSAKVAAFETAKKNPGNRRMATVASVYTVDPHVRTAEEITAALFRDEPEKEAPKTQRPRPQNKNTTAHFPEVADNGDGGELAISGIHVAMAWIMGQVATRRRSGQVLIALMDGQESLWQTMQMHLCFGSRTVPVLDVLHALAYVWEAAGLFAKEDAKRKAFTRERLLRILRGEVRSVIRGLRRLGTTKKLSGKALKDLTRICGYLGKNADRMRYDEYLRRGYPIASGVIEGACRHLVKDRMERSGMRWTLEGARSMLHVRAAFQSNHWRSFMDHRMRKEISQTHRHRHLMGDYQPLALAC
jgi:hypothetical protein